MVWSANQKQSRRGGSSRVVLNNNKSGFDPPGGANFQKRVANAPQISAPNVAEKRPFGASARCGSPFLANHNMDLTKSVTKSIKNKKRDPD